MMKTKIKILNAARALFNTAGYSQVTIRLIAQNLGMSSGNLNYHFRKREDIFEALYFEMVEVFDQRVESLEEQNISLPYLKEQVEQSMKQMLSYRFFWTDLYNLLKISTSVRAHFYKVRADRIKGYQFLFKSLIEQNLLSEPTFPKEDFLLSERLIDYSNTWLYASIVQNTPTSEQLLIEQSAFHLLSMLYPYLTDQGKDQFRLLYALE